MSARQVTLWACLIASLSINGFQGARILKLEQASAVPGGALLEGAKLTRIAAKDLADRKKSVDFASKSKPTILYVFKPSCMWCQHNGAYLDSLAKQVRDRYNLVALSLSSDGLGEFLKEHPIGFPVFKDAPDEFVQMYHLGVTPQTIVVSEDGYVVKVFDGAYGGAVRGMVEEFFRIRLPL